MKHAGGWAGLLLAMVLSLGATRASTQAEWVAPIAKSTVKVTVTLTPDSSLKVVTVWGYKVAPASGLPDSTRFKVGLGTVTSTTPSKFVKWLPATSLLSRDTSVVPVATYGTITGFSCMTPHRRGSWSKTQTCVAWAFVRPDAVVPPFDTSSASVLSIVIKPSGAQIATDIGVACRHWQESNPNLSPWIIVNSKAVAPCMGDPINPMPIIAQFCAFVILKDGQWLKSNNSSDELAVPGRTAEYNYCDDKYKSWLSERST